MIIWTRWGFFAVIFIGVGVGLGFALKAAFGLGGLDESAVNGIFVGVGFVLSAVGLFFFERFVVRRHLDEPRPMMVARQLAESRRLANGAVQTTEMVPAVIPGTTVPAVVQPRSTFFAIPLRLWPFLIAVLGVVVLIINLVRVMVG
ncbi:hypothetical protein ET475_04120 [Microbacterium protaetiae]|uniref:Uncharacterized protein n=1 Tax=Microbacterium protaetiae TaxID=2509458 RepID=A0A4P6EAW8_9MICO|nr:hypothetical protein [Microbacterium protaetiae]QAY59255.1 hypothetical protein ET475_04120 [Microbacterium protaetiae]